MNFVKAMKNDTNLKTKIAEFVIFINYRIPSNIASPSNKDPLSKIKKNLTTDMDVSDYLWKLFFWIGTFEK